MAQRTIIKLVDDLDDKEIEDGGQTVSFGYNPACQGELRPAVQSKSA